MENLMSIIENGSGKIKLEVSGEDLLTFSNQLIKRTKEELASVVVEKNREETYLTKADVKHLCGICDTTVWYWQRRGYLSPVRIGGRKILYKKSDIDKILTGNIEKAQ
jgi:predicted DNA-binding transcriptional regulator AlpA